MLKTSRNVYRVLISFEINVLLLNLLMTGDRFAILNGDPEVFKEVLNKNGVYLEGLVTIYIISLHTLISIIGVVLYIFQLSEYHSVFENISGKEETNGVDFAVGIMFLLYHITVTIYSLTKIYDEFKDLIKVVITF